MKNRITAIVYILLANIILMAPIVVPHHHHAEKLCIEKTHCPSEKDAHQQENPEHKHEHDGENSSEYCSLKQVVVLPANQVVPVTKFQKSKNNLASISVSNTVLSKAFVYKFVANYVSKTLISFQVSALGLRGPPIV